MPGKDILLSATFWGLVLALGAPILAQHGITIDQTGLANDIVAAAGAILSIVGRITAKKPITSVAGVPVGSGGKPPIGGAGAIILACIVLSSVAACGPTPEPVTATTGQPATAAEQAAAQATRAAQERAKRVVLAYGVCVTLEDTIRGAAYAERSGLLPVKADIVDTAVQAVSGPCGNRGLLASLTDGTSTILALTKQSSLPSLGGLQAETEKSGKPNKAAIVAYFGQLILDSSIRIGVAASNPPLTDEAIDRLAENQADGMADAVAAWRAARG